MTTIGKIKAVPLIRDNYKEYLIEVCSDRALSDIYDGLKPAQRRLLWTAYTMGLHHNKAHVKSARIDGNCMANFHAHSCLSGDTKVKLLNGSVKTMLELYKSGKSEWVLSYDEKKKVLVPALAHHFRVGKSDDLSFTFELNDGSSFTCTDNHRFLINGKWTRADEIQKGDNIAGAWYSIGRGYEQIVTNFGKVLKKQQIYRIVKQTKKYSGLNVHHIDGNRLNNSPDNLRILTAKEHTILHEQQGDHENSRFSKSSSIWTKYRNETRQKNSEIIKAVNKKMSLYKAYKVCSLILDSGKKISNSTYIEFRPYIYNAPFLETILEKGFKSVKELYSTRSDWKADTSKSKGLIAHKKVRKLRSYWSGSASHQLYVEKVIVNRHRKKKFYDFSVDKYQNMLILASDNTAVLAHNSTYGVLVGMAQACSAFPLIDGQGNWGYLGDTSLAAASRYTEARLSKLAEEVLLDSDYLAVSQMVPNYDDTKLEPVRLPAKLPVLLLMGSSGIAVGTRANIPAFTWKSLKPVLIKALKCKITYKDCLGLKINDLLGAVYAGTKEEWINYIKTGKGCLKMTSKLEVEGKLLHIYSLSQSFDSAVDKLERQDYVHSVSDLSNNEGVHLIVKFKSSYKESDMPALKDKVQKLLTNSMNFNLSTNVIETRADIDVQTENKTVYKTGAKYMELDIASLINAWTEWRIKLEKKMLANRIKVAQKEIDKLKLFVYAISKLDVIFKVLKTAKSDVDEKLAKALKITVEQAKTILDKSVRSLSSLSKDKLLSDIKDLKSKIESDSAKYKSPRKTIYNWIKGLQI